MKFSYTCRCNLDIENILLIVEIPPYVNTVTFRHIFWWFFSWRPSGSSLFVTLTIFIIHLKSHPWPTITPVREVGREGVNTFFLARAEDSTTFFIRNYFLCHFFFVGTRNRSKKNSVVATRLGNFISLAVFVPPIHQVCYILFYFTLFRF